MRGVVIVLVALLSMTILVSAQSVIIRTSMPPDEFKGVSSGPEFYLSLGNWLYMNGNTETAKMAYEKGLEIRQNPAILHNLGKAAYDEGNYLEARDYFNKALEVDQQHTKAMYSLGVLSLNEAKYSEAAAWFQKYTELLPSADAYCQYGNALAMEARYNKADTLDRAINAYKQCVQLNPDWTEAKTNLDVLERVKASS